MMHEIQEGVAIVIEIWPAMSYPATIMTILSWAGLLILRSMAPVLSHHSSALGWMC